MTILCYHSVTSGWTDPVSVETTDFERQCRLLHHRGGVVPLASIEDRLATTGRPPRGTHVLTFDDGFADFADTAVPVLRRWRLPATMYVVAGSLTEAGAPVDWVTGLDPADAPPLLSGEQIQELHADGWDIASHSMWHRDLPTLGESECVQDLRQSRELLEDLLGAAVTTLAYPFGRHAPHVRRAAERAGYRIALALPSGPEEPGPFAVPRTGIYRGNGVGTFTLKTAPWYPSLRTSRAVSCCLRTVQTTTLAATSAIRRRQS